MKKAALVLAASVLLCCNTAAAAGLLSPMPRPEKFSTDIVQVTEFKIANFQAVGTPIGLGDQVALVLTVKNVSSKTLPKVIAVMSQISPLPAPAPFNCTRFRDNVAPNESFELSCSLPATTVGRITFRGQIDDARTPEAHEANLLDRRNNSRELTIDTIVAVQRTDSSSVRAVAPIVEAWLNPQKAREARMGPMDLVAIAVNHNVSGCKYIQVEAVDHIRVGVDCRNNAKGQGDVKDFHLYDGFKLKRGWVVERVEPPDLGATRLRGSSITEAAAVGSDAPVMRMRISASLGNVKEDTVRIRIRGPQDKDPYQ